MIRQKDVRRKGQAMTDWQDIATAPKDGHNWFRRFGLTCCKSCGVVKRADGLNNQCPGKVRVELRENRIKSAINPMPLPSQPEQ